MESFVIKQLVVSILKFLRQQVESLNSPESLLNEEGVESVEVALQCLGAAYNLSTSELETSQSLYTIFNNAIEHQATSSDMETETTCVENKDEASVENKDEAEVLKAIGNDFMRKKKFNEAITIYTRAIEMDPLNAAYYCNRAAAYSKLNLHTKAIADSRMALEIDPNRSKTYSRMGFAYSETDPEMAQQCYKKALELDPENEIYRNNLKLADERIQSQSQSSSSGSNNVAASFLSGLAGNVGSGNFPSVPGMDGDGSSGTPNIANLFNNPNLMSMASQLMTDPNMQNMLSGLFTGQGGRNQTPSQPEANPTATDTASTATSSNPPSTDAASGGLNMDFLLNAGVQLAEQMQAQNPQLVEQLRSQLSRSNLRRGENPDRNPPS